MARWTAKAAAKRFFFFLLKVYIGLVVVLFVFQRQMLYAPWGTPKPLNEYEGLAQFQTVVLTAKDGNPTFGWYAPPPSPDAYTIVFFHGNGGNLSLWDSAFALMHQHKFGVLAVEYRGYGGAVGDVGEENFYADARAGIDYLIQTAKIPQSKIILMGHSMGSGVAVQMATEYDLAAMVLISPYINVAAVGKDRFPYIPVDLLLRERFDSIAKITRVAEPILIFHGDADTLIRAEQSQELFDAATSPKERILMPGIGHDNVNFAVMIPKTEEWLKRLALP